MGIIAHVYFLRPFAGAELPLALILLVTVAPNARGSGIFSGASVGSDGTVYGWGVTNVSGTPTSPNGRHASGNYNATDCARNDVSLPYDPSDGGTYLVQSQSSVYCTAAGAWIVWNAYSQAQASVSVPYSVGVVGTILQAPANCPPGQSGWSRTAYLQLYDQLGLPIQFSSIDVADSIQIVQGQNGLGIGNPQTGHHGTDDWGQWPDAYDVCSPACPGSSAETDAFQWWTANGIPVVQPDLLICKCGSITVNGR
jgi:hypothetical protein